MDVPAALAELARELGVLTHFVDGLKRSITVSPETLVRVCRARGADLDGPEDAEAALAALREQRAGEVLPPVVVAWDGRLDVLLGAGAGAGTDAEERRITVRLEDGETVSGTIAAGRTWTCDPLPFGYHTMEVVLGDTTHRAHVISAPVRAFRRADTGPATRRWGVGTQLGALRTRRSRSLGDLRDLESTCRRIGELGGELVTVLPLLPTFNDAQDPEPSPYSPASRLFWSELILDLEDAHVPTDAPDRLDVVAADAEVRAWIETRPDPDPADVDDELRAYARFRGAQKILGRNWRAWPEPARSGELSDEQVDAAEAAFHVKAQLAVRAQLGALLEALDPTGVAIGLDLAVGAHPDSFDTWSRPDVFATGMSVGAPPDGGFPSGQDWGFAPVDPTRSRETGHRYLAESIAHQAALCGVLRVDHVMAFARLYWIPHGMSLHEGTYVAYPPDELFAILCLESHRHRCEVVGENLGTVPPEIEEALPRHGIWGMDLATFVAGAEHPAPPSEDAVGFIGTHDTPTFAGWVAGADIGARVAAGLLDPDAEPAEREGRDHAVRNFARHLGTRPEDLSDYLTCVLEWLGRSPSPLIIPWIEDLWLEEGQVNLPGTRSSEQPNWQRTMRGPVEELLADPDVLQRVELMHAARRRASEAARS